MKIIKLLGFLSIICISGMTISQQEKERFEGQFLLLDCLEEIPVSYSTKDKEAFLNAVNRLEGVELVLVNAKKRKNVTYQFYYFEKTKTIDGETAFLTVKEQYNKSSSLKSALFLKYKKGKHFFYRADCFREIFDSNSLLKNVLKPE